MSIKKFLIEGEKADLFSIKEVAEHGCSGGLIPSLIHYVDTVKFYEEHEKEIWEQLYQESNDMGSGCILKHISRFNGAMDVGSMTQLKNLLAWWACEQAAHDILADRKVEE